MIGNTLLSYKAVWLLLVLFCFTTTWGVKFPPYIKRCTFDDSLPQCIINQLPVITPHFKEEIKEFGIPVISPYHKEKLTLDVGENLKIKTTDLDIFHTDKFDLKQFRVNLTSYDVDTLFYFPKLEIIGTYDINGKILLLPIKGHGSINLSVTNFTVTFSFKLIPVEKTGQIYRFPTEQMLKYKAGTISMALSNLFNGDKVLGDQVNSFLNENWKEVELFVRPAILEAIDGFVGPVFDKFFNVAPFNELFIVP